MGFNPISLVEDTLQAGADVVSEVGGAIGDGVQSVVDKPLSLLYAPVALTKGIGRTALSGAERQGRAMLGFNQKIAEELKRGAIGQELRRGIAKLTPSQQSSDPTSVSLVEDATSPQTFDPRGTRGSRGNVSTQTQSILTPTAEQPTLLG